MVHLDLFSGIGGFSLAAQWVWGKEHHIHYFVEIDPFCQQVLKKHWPQVPIHDDIRTYKHDGTKIDLLSAGTPCQPASIAGKRRGSEDDRWLWPEALRIVGECKPKWIIFENVYGFITLNEGMELDKVLSDLENQGYETQTFIIPACAVDAPHRRDRVWIVAYSAEQREGWGRIQRPDKDQTAIKEWASDKFTGPSKNVADTNSTRCETSRPALSQKRKTTHTLSRLTDQQRSKYAKWFPEPNVGRVADGIPGRVDRLRALGNAIVPQVVVPIMEAIKEVEVALNLPTQPLTCTTTDR